MLDPMTRSRLLAGALAAGLLAVAAPAAHGHALGYFDPSEPGLKPTDDIVAATVHHWTTSWPPTVGPPPVTLKHSVAVAGPYGSRPCLRIRAGADQFRICDGDIRKTSLLTAPTVGTAQVVESPAIPGQAQTVMYTFQLGAIGNPASYEWGTWAPNDVSPLYIGSDVLDPGWHTHTIRHELSPIRP
jgi:hypothetical protein